MLRAAPILLLLASLFVVATPAAATCKYSDPTGLTTTCIGDYTHETGDPACDENGYHYGSTWFATGRSGVADVRAGGEEWCHQSGGWSHDGQSIRAGVSVHPVVAIGVRYADWSENGDNTCVLIVTIMTPAYSIEYPKDCKGGLPVLPWGDLLPE